MTANWKQTLSFFQNDDSVPNVETEAMRSILSVVVYSWNVNNSAFGFICVLVYIAGF